LAEQRQELAKLGSHPGFITSNLKAVFCNIQWGTIYPEEGIEMSGIFSIHPDLIMTNGNIITVDNDFSIAEAVAIKGDRIVGVGTEADIISLFGEKTQMMNLQGATVLPGINDAHCHLNGFGLERPPLMLDLSYPGIKSMVDIRAAIKDRIAEVGPHKWISGWGWDRGFLEEYKNSGRYPDKSDIDEVSPDNPVILTEFSGHTALCNSKALEHARIDRNTPDPESGMIQRDESGNPTGIVFEKAVWAVRELMPPPTESERKNAILNAMSELNSLGITSVTEPGLGPDQLRIYTELLNEEKITVRINAMIMGGKSPEELKNSLSHIGTCTGFGNDFLRISGLKMLADGIPPSKTAYMYDEYIGGGHGQLLVEGRTDEERYENLVEMIKYGHSKGFQIGIHVTGDRGIDACVDGYIAALKERPWDARHYVIHSDFATPECLERMAEYNIGASVQSSIKWTIGNLMVGIVGEEKAAYHWPLKTMIDKGVVVANGSDASVTYPDWRQGVESAVLRKDKATGDVIGADQCITVEHAIRSYTINGAWQDHQEKVKGSIEPGKLADFCVIRDDILDIHPDKISKIPILMTIVGGKVVYSDAA
jgi:predicted amidohydrolase YtcJ